MNKIERTSKALKIARARLTKAEETLNIALERSYLLVGTWGSRQQVEAADKAFAIALRKVIDLQEVLEGEAARYGLTLID